MNKEKKPSESRRAPYSRSRRKNKGIKTFASGGTYLLIPLLGIVLALTLFYFAKDFFLGEETPQYHKPEFTVAEESRLSGSADIEEAGTEGKAMDSAIAVPAAKPGQSGAEKQPVEAKPAIKTSGALPQSQNISGVEKFMEDPSWGVQIAMLKSREDADRLAAEVSKKGFNPDITKPGDYYRVRIRGGSTRASAEGIEKLLKSEGYDTLVVLSDGVTALPSSPSVAPPAATSSSSTTSATGYHEDDIWGVQVGMLKNRSDADRIAEEIRKKGFNVDITRPGDYYRVRVRGGSSEESARKTEELLVARGYSTLVVKSVD